MSSSTPTSRALQARAGTARRKAAAPRKHYHHGDLRHALIEATESLVAERGADGFSLREVARRAGVSPSAPAHHFGDAAGLLAAVCTLAFEQLTAALREGEAQAGDGAVERLVGQGLGYIGFAMQRPERFRLMFRSGVLEPTEELLLQANAAFDTLQQGVAALLGGQADAATQRRVTIAMWALVHGYAHLAIAGKLDPLLHDLPRERWLDEVVRPALTPMAAALAATALPPKARAARRQSAR
jgi:AcrR family transcriptional regulator